MKSLLIPIGLTVLGYFFGRAAEARHYQQIRKRERETAFFPVTTSKHLPNNTELCHIMSASVVLSDDYFKRIFAALKNLVGGRLTAYESLLDRARREAMVRLKQEALKSGFKGIVHVHLETSNLFAEGQKRSLGTVQIIATGTAYR